MKKSSKEKNAKIKGLKTLNENGFEKSSTFNYKYVPARTPTLLQGWGLLGNSFFQLYRCGASIMAAFIAQSAMWYMHFVHFGKVIPQKRQVYPCCVADGPVTDLHMSRIRFSLPERSYPTYLPDIGPYPVPPLCSPKACMKLFSRASMGMAAKSEAQVPQGIHRGMSFLQPWHLKPLPPTRKSAGVLGARST